MRLQLAAGVLAALAVGAHAATLQDPASPAPATADQLLPGVEIAGALDPSGVATYRFALAAEEAVEVVVSQPDVDLRLVLLDPSGQQLQRVDLRRPHHGVERLHAVAASDGMHVLRVERSSPPTPIAPTSVDVRFATTLATVHPATDRDRAMSAATLAYSRADTEVARGTGESLRAALGQFQSALAAWKSADAPFEEATTFHRIGFVQMQLSNLPDALTAYGEALRLRREIGDRYGEGASLNQLAATYNRQGDYEKAETSYEEALRVRREVGDRENEGWTLIGLAVVQAVRTGTWGTARAYFKQALDLFAEFNDGRGEAEALYMLGYAHKQLNEFDAAMAHFERALALRRQQNDTAGQATILNQAAAVHLQLGDAERALQLIDDTLALRRRAGDRRGEAYTLQTSGVALTDLGNYVPAIERLSEALQLFEGVGDREGQTSALAHLARLRAAMGEPRLSLDLAQRAHRVLDGARNLMTTTLLSTMGDAQLALGQVEDARASYSNALGESRRLGETLPTARALTGLGRVARARGDLAASRRHLLEALDLIESVRAGVARSEFRASFLGLTQNAYESAIDTLMDLHQQEPAGAYAAEALAVSERRRARTLLETLAEARADLRSEADANLIEREDTLQRRLNASSAKRAALGAEESDTARRASLDREIADVVADLREVRTAIRTRSPRYAALMNPTSLDLAGIQRLLDSDTVLLEYSLGAGRSYVWAITPTTMTVHELPGRALIEAAAMRVHGLVTESTRRGLRGPLRRALGELSAMVLGPVTRELATSNAYQRKVVDRPATLGHDLWAVPTERPLHVSSVPSTKRLVIVADGALQYVPFAALPHPSRTVGTGALEEPLIVKHEIVMLPSASTVDLLRQAPIDRAASRKTVAVFADPVLQSDDSRLMATRTTAAAAPPTGGKDPNADDRIGGSRTSRDLTRAADTLGLARFERLPHTGDEAAVIAAKAGPTASLTALGFDATRERALSPDLADFRIVHFATHTILDARHPELSGIVLTLVNRQSQPVDGFLRLHDIFNLRLSTEVVVLSACQTALGRDVRGEGLIGLARGFMHAGASQVVASLWNVRDRATAKLMEQFYAGLLDRGLTPAAALRAAQIHMWRNPQSHMPVYWAGFIVQGDWRARAR